MKRISSLLLNYQVRNGGLLFLVLVFNFQLALGQNKKVDYKVKYDGNMPFLRLDLEPIYIDAHMTNINAGFGIKPDLYISNRFFLNLAYRHSYYDLNTPDPSMAYSEDSKVSTFEAIANINFKVKVKKAKVKYITSSKYIGAVNEWNAQKKTSEIKSQFLEKYFLADAAEKTMFGFRGGFKKLNTSYYSGDYEIGNFYTKDPNGNKLVFCTACNEPKLSYWVDGNMAISTLVLGIGRQRLIQAALKTTDYGIFSTNELRHIYFDFFVGANTTFSSVTYQGNSYNIYNDVLSASGWRFGYKYGTSYRIVNLWWLAELGKYPGPNGKSEDAAFDPRFFINLGFGVTIPTLIGNKMPD